MRDYLLFFVEAVVYQLLQRLQGSLLVITIDVEIQYGTFAGSKHHNGHNAFRVHHFAVFTGLDGAGESRCASHELGCGTSVQTEFVNDEDLSLDHV
jgi:hypothetical protein